MRAMVLREPGPADTDRLREESVPVPEPGPGEVLVRVSACGVCRTDLHVVEGDLPPRGRPVIPGHEIVGTIERVGPSVRALREGQVVGIPWLAFVCGECAFCRSGRENLCDRKRFTGYTDDGGYSEHVLGREGFLFPISPPDPFRFAPFLCAGIIGYRAFKLARPADGGRIGFFGFGGSAHLALQLAKRLGFETVAYSRTPAHLELARELGASETVLTGANSSPSGAPRLDAAIVFAPAGEVVVQALAEVRKGATVAIPAIHMTAIPPIDYDRRLAGERRLVSVEANTRADALEFLELAARFDLTSRVEVRPLAEANAALRDLRAGRVVGAVVLDARR